LYHGNLDTLIGSKAIHELNSSVTNPKAVLMGNRNHQPSVLQYEP